MIKNSYATVSWTVDDVMENCKQFGIHIKKHDAEKVLTLNDSKIVDAMIIAGWEVIEGSLIKYKGLHE